MADVATRKIYSWAFESHIAGVITTATLGEAAAQFLAESGGGAQVWLLDAGDASDYDDDVLPALHETTAWLKTKGLRTVAMIVPPRARMGLELFASSMPVRVRSFDSEPEALYWIQCKCP